MIEITKLTAGYPGRTVLRSLNLHIPAGKVTVIAGPNGCGKSTLLKTIAGILPVTGGEITIGGRTVSEFQGRELARQVAYLSQNRQVPEITAERMVLHGRFPWLGYPRRYRPEDLKIAREAMARMGIGELAQQNLSALSGGQRQKVYIAMALAQDTPVILMDEPTTFLDAAHQMQMMDHARFLADSGKTVVMVLHDLPMAMQAADSLAVMSAGQMIQVGSPEEIYESGCVNAAFGVAMDRVWTGTRWQYYFERR